MNFFDQFNKEHIIIAHRGFRSYRAENTMEAFRASMGKCDMFEFDIQFTKDLKPIIMHDNSLIRTTNVKDVFKNRISYDIKDFFLYEIQQLDDSSWFKKHDPFKTIKNKKVSIEELDSTKKSCVAILDDVLKFIKRYSFPANLEIKDTSHFDTNLIVDEVCTHIVNHNAISDCIVSSFNHNFLRKIKQNLPDIKIAALFEEKDQDNIYEYLLDMKVDAYHIDISLVNQQKIEKLKSLGIYTNVYTINSNQKKRELFSLGVKGIFTDYL